MAKPQSKTRDIAEAMSEAVRAWHSLDGHERDEAVLLFLPSVEFWCKRMIARLQPSIDVRDIIQSGVVGLLDALDKFDPSRDTSIKTYAEIRVRGAVLDYLRSLDWVPRSVRRFNRKLDQLRWRLSQEYKRQPTDSELAQALGITLDEFTERHSEAHVPQVLDLDWNETASAGLHEVIKDRQAADPLKTMVVAETEELIAKAIESLPLKQRIIVSLYFFEGMTMAEIGEQLGHSESRVSQVLTKALLTKIAPALQSFIRPG